MGAYCPCVRNESGTNSSGVKEILASNAPTDASVCRSESTNVDDLSASCNSGDVDFLCGVTREMDHGHDELWRRKWAARRLITIETYLVNTDVWRCTPSLKRHREIPKTQLKRVSQAFGERVAAALTRQRKPAVICVERPYLDGFIEGARDRSEVPIVLLVVNGGDAPLTLDQQDRICNMSGIRACFANNLHSPRNSLLFHPLPLGIDGEIHVDQVRKSMQPWPARDKRLLIAPMRITNRLRKQYLDLFGGQEYADLVRIVSGRLAFKDFLSLLSEHQSVLSPPGRGYDCGRTWQALSVGTVPLVVEDVMFDQRVHTTSGAEFIPHPDQLTAEKLKQLLSGLQDPGRFVEKLDVANWKSLWNSYLC